MLELPLEVDDLTPEWMSDAMDADVDTVTVLDRHSGTTGRAHLALTGHASVPPTVFVKLAPFDGGQRKFVNEQGMGIAEARLYRDVAHELPVRVPKTWFAEFDGTGSDADDRYVMVLEDLVASGCRFPTRDDADIEARLFDIIENLARLHAQYWKSPRFGPRGDLDWIAPRSTGSGDGGAAMVRIAIENLVRPAPRRIRSTSRRPTSQRAGDIMRLYREGYCTLVHGDPHLGNLFVDGVDPRRTGFLDWAMVAHAPGIRDVAYVLANSTPTELRRTHEQRAARAVPRDPRRARHHARRRPRVGAIPAVHDLRMVLGHVHRGHGFEVATRARRVGRYRAVDDRRARPRRDRPARRSSCL